MPIEPTLGWAAIDWIEHFLVHGPGDVQGQRIDLDDEFAEFILKAYRVDSETGERRIRRAFLSRAKGRSKSGLAAMIECFEALGPCRFDHWAEAGEVSYWGYEYDEGEPVGTALEYVEILNVATEEGQAGNTYDAVYFMLNEDTCSKALLAEFGKIDVGLARINLPDRRGWIEPVSSADNSKDGGKSTFIVADETHLWILPRLHRLHGIMTRNLLKRKAASGWMLETSTMYAEGEGSVAEGTHAYAKSGSRSKNFLLFDHRQASETWDLTKRRDRIEALKESYGPAAAWMNLEAISDSWDDPQVSEASFRRFWLNQPVPLEETVSVVPLSLWALELDVTSKTAGPVSFSLDVSPNRSHAAIAVVGANSDGMWHLEVTSRQGVFDARPGLDWVIPRLTALVEAFPNMDLAIASRSAAESLVPAIEALGVKVTTINDLPAACGYFYDRVVAQEVRHLGQQPLNEALAAATRRDVGDNAFVWWRRKSSSDISALYAVTLALWQAEQERNNSMSAINNVW